MKMRVRRSVKIASGVRVNFGKGGLTSVSFGGRGARATVGRGGRVTRSVGIPGSGVSFTSSGSRRSTPQPAPVQPQTPKPGLFASAAEKRFHEGVVAYQAGDLQNARAALYASSAADRNQPSPYLLGGIVAMGLDDLAVASTYLEWVVQNAALPDALMSKYLPGAAARIPITQRVSVFADLSTVGAPLLLAEVYQRQGRLEEAIGLMQQMHDSAPWDDTIRLSLADLLFEDGDDEAVVELASNISNKDDATLGILHLKAKALLRSGMASAGLSELSACLKRTSGRDPELLREIRYDKASALEASGQVAKARAEWEKLYADDPGFRDVKERLASGKA